MQSVNLEAQAKHSENEIESKEKSTGSKSTGSGLEINGGQVLYCAFLVFRFKEFDPINLKTTLTLFPYLTDRTLSLLSHSSIAYFQA